MKLISFASFKHIQNKFPLSEWIVTADADGQHLVPDIRHIAQSLAANPTHLYLGVRRLKHNKKLPLLNRLGNLFTRNIFEYLLGKTISDTQTGLRGIPARYLLTLLGVPASGFDFELDVLVEATNRQWPIDEVRIQTVYEKQARLLDVLKDNIKIFVVFIRFSAVALCSAGLDYGLFSLTYFYTQNILTSTITARVCSSIFNFTGSRLITFRSKGNVVHEAVKYFSLVGLFMVLSYTVVSSITHLLGISAYISKLLGEGLLFFASFAIQHFLIFNTKKDSSQN